MKTDEKYIYPESAEELAMFYGWESERNDFGIWREDTSIESGKIMYVDVEQLSFRIPLPTINDLKVGDVVRYAGAPNSVELWQAREQQFKDGCDITDVFGPISLLIGRNTWVPVKCD